MDTDWLPALVRGKGPAKSRDEQYKYCTIPLNRQRLQCSRAGSKLNVQLLTVRASLQHPDHIITHARPLYKKTNM
jgi:hypothetical protein